MKKQKKFEKKLALNKTTITSLNSNEMILVQGGIGSYVSSCADACNIRKQDFEGSG
ncbi:MAG: hypothetical protein GY757_32800 [bacterium]|nr:hypothetical protein [bacterium]